LVLAAAGTAAEGEVQGGEGETGIDDATEHMRGPDAQAFYVGAAMVGIGQRFENAPGAETEEAEGDQNEPDLAEGLREKRLQRAAAASRLTARAEGSEERQAADKAVDHAPRTIAESGQGLDRIAADMRHG
jgi:hypothetical protein